MNKEQFIKQVVKLNPHIRFLYYYNGFPSKTWFTYSQIINKYPNLFKVNNQMLRTGIVTDTFEEMRLDIDSKLNGVKNLDESIKTAEKICKILDKENIKYSLYYGGGFGLHFHILYFNKQFKQFSNQKQVRELICEYLGFINDIDKQLLSNNQQMTCEGYCKRKSKDNSLKIYIGEEKRNIKKYIEENKYKTIINPNYFNEINTFPNEYVKYVEQEYNAHTIQNKVVPKPIKQEFISSDTYTNPQIKREGFIMPSEKVIIQHLITFSKIYNEKGIKSTNNFYTIICTYIYSSTLDYDKALYYFNFYFDVLGGSDNLTCSREQKLKTIINNFHEGKTKLFIQNDYLTDKEFWSSYYNLFPKKEVSQ